MLLERENVENDVSEAIEEVIADGVNDEMEQEEEMDDGLRMLRMDDKDDDDEEFEFDEVFLANGSVAEEVDAVPDNWMPRLR